MTAVAIRSLSMTYPGASAAALDSLSLDIAAGTLTALLGPSGCGKTTALKLIGGLLAPSGGDVRFDGLSVLHLPPEQRSAAMVFQSGLLFPHMTVAQNIGFGLRMRRVPAAQVAAQVAEMLARVQLSDLGARKPAALSGGQQQRVALARALILRPRVLLLDEPLSGLDAGLRVDMRALIRTLQQDMAITTIMVTHDQEEAAAMADHIALILNGMLHQHGRPEALYNRPADRAVARFFGGRNFVSGHARGQTFHSPLGPLRLPSGAAQGPGTLTFRPESIRPGSAPGNTLAVTVTEKTYLGTRTSLTLAAADQTLTATLPPDMAAEIVAGQQITVNVPPESLWVMADQAHAASEPHGF